MRSQGEHKGRDAHNGRPVRHGKTADKLNASVEKERNAAAMKKVMEPPQQEPLKAEVRPAPGSQDAHELFAPQEWDSLLSGIEQDGAAARAAHHPYDLWEQLSKTGWLQKRPGDAPPERKLAQRPSA